MNEPIFRVEDTPKIVKTEKTRTMYADRQSHEQNSLHNDLIRGRT